VFAGTLGSTSSTWVRAQLPPLIRVPVRVVEVPTAVLDRNGKPIRGLTAGDFQLLDNNRAQQVRLDYIDQPLSVAITVQNNDSARTWLPQVARVKSLIESLLVGANGEASVGVFSDEVRAIQPLTERVELLDKALQSIRPTLADRSRTLDAVRRKDWSTRRRIAAG
jgi:hypothetical protein